MKFLGLSLVLHGLLLIQLNHIESPKTLSNPIFELEVKESPRKKSFSGSLGLAYSRPSVFKRGFLSNQRLYSSDVGEQATADNYLERIESLVGHPWRYRVGPRVKQLFRERRKYKCLSCFHLLLNSSGTPIDTKKAIVCNDPEIQAITAYVLNRNFPPVPENLLAEGHLLLEWCFEVK